MIFAKCIRESQVLRTKEDFWARQSEEYSVYCEGAITYSKQNADTLYCVPLNFIYDCLKYGTYIAIVEVENSEVYPNRSSYMGCMRAMSEQMICKIFDAFSYEAVDYVFNNVEDKKLIHAGYLRELPKEIQVYFRKRLQ